MVDSIKGLGQLPKVVLGKTSSEQTERVPDAKATSQTSQDKVEISVQALSQQEAERVATKVRDDLQQQPQVTLGSRSEPVRADTV